MVYWSDITRTCQKFHNKAQSYRAGNISVWNFIKVMNQTMNLGFFDMWSLAKAIKNSKTVFEGVWEWFDKRKPSITMPGLFRLDKEVFPENNSKQ